MYAVPTIILNIIRNFNSDAILGAVGRCRCISLELFGRSNAVSSASYGNSDIGLFIEEFLSNCSSVLSDFQFPFAIR